MDESKELVAFQRSLVILGPAGGAVLVCPGNQVGVPTEQRCAYAAKCPLRRAGKAPADKLRPIERALTEERFSSWSRTVGQDPEYLTEDARSTVSTLTYIDIQEQRCTNILATGEAARLTQTNVTEAIDFTTQDAEGAQTQTVLPLTWERVLHINAELLAQLQVQRRIPHGGTAHIRQFRGEERIYLQSSEHKSSSRLRCIRLCSLAKLLRNHHQRLCP
jgi:hypothetical protein